ncbi:MAG: serine hydrolase [Flavobacteriales bacterium]|nr:serine hydrolase [Flavobacteriales bacterium]MDW8432768.1 glycoside hydrolase family 3 N-terminal domain-containing protein [Flavobacteriales bacterium]
MRYPAWLPFLLLAWQEFSTGQKALNYPEPAQRPPMDATVAIPPEAYVWADSVMATLTPDERVAQLFMVAAYSNKDARHEQATEDLVRRWGVGGLIFFQGTPGKQAALTNRYQKAAKVKLLIAGDYEWGLSMRLDSCPRFPWQMTLGAVQEDSLIFHVGAEMARQLKRLGVNVSFSPVLDVNNNPRNPIINARSFGEDRVQVMRKGLALAAGLQKNGVMACGKHFPGHGDTDKDSHKELPSILHPLERLDSVELFPFRAAVARGLQSVMVAHLYVPVLDSTKHLATSLSHQTVTGLLRRALGFQGLVFTDALNMSGVSKYFPPGQVEVLALKAGVDILLMPENVPLALEKIREAIQKGTLQSAELDARCRKVLAYKYVLGLNRWKPVDLKGLREDLWNPSFHLIQRKVVAASLTLLKNENELLPLGGYDTLRPVLVTVGAQEDEVFSRTLNFYLPFKIHRLPENPDSQQLKAAEEVVREGNLLVLSWHKAVNNPWKVQKIPDWLPSFTTKLARRVPTVAVVFANPYSLSAFPETIQVHGLLAAYQDIPEAQELAAQALFGALPVRGRLPVTASPFLRCGAGLDVVARPVLRFGIPEEAGFSSKALQKVDEIAQEGMTARAYPGCVVLAARHGLVFFYKAFGNTMYSGGEPVKKEDLYDLASVTKITATLPLCMMLYDQGRLNLKAVVGDYLAESRGSRVASLKIEDLLTHQAGLKAWVPFYQKTLRPGGKLREDFYSHTPDALHTLQVAEGIYVKPSIVDSVFQWIFETPVNTGQGYVYSDLGLYLMARICERLLGGRLDSLSSKLIFRKLGAYTTTYNPRLRFPVERIVPTAVDSSFRKQLLRGWVHDEGAALCGGVAGHAGVFSNAVDLAKVMQMYLNQGRYGTEVFFSPATVQEFTRCRFCKQGNRRALGFDRKEPGSKGPPCECVSLASYGHTGFTGTMAWMDPENGLLFIFLSNRIHPSPHNKILIDKNIRARIQQVFYDAMGKMMPDMD